MNLKRCSNEKIMSQPQWVLTQKKTFTKWANVQLSGAYVINDVETDLNDGLILISLFEALRKQKVQFRYNKKPKMRVAKLENTEQALNFIKADGVKLVNIDAQNIVDGNLTLILGLLWTLILKYQIAQNKMDASKNALLEWVNSKLTSRKIKNFSNDWNTGDVLNELIHALEPDFIDLADSASKGEGEERIQYGLSIAEDKMEIPAIIAAEDMALPEPDELSVMAYVSYFRHYEAEKEKRLGEAERLAREAELMRTPDPSKCVMSGPGLKTGEVLVPQEFTVTAKNCKGDQITQGGVTWNAHVFDPEGNEIPIEQSLFESCVGTPQYMAPEVSFVNLKGNYTINADMYSLGVCLYYLVSQRWPPIQNKDSLWICIDSNISNDLVFPDGFNKDFIYIIQQMLEIDVKKRISWDELFVHPFITQKLQCVFVDINQFFVKSLLPPPQALINAQKIKISTPRVRHQRNDFSMEEDDDNDDFDKIIQCFKSNDEIFDDDWIEALNACKRRNVIISSLRISEDCLNSFLEFIKGTITDPVEMPETLKFENCEIPSSLKKDVYYISTHFDIVFDSISTKFY
ncbi:hypothetical protein CL6EHI_094070 [Entamoeba histolytica]|uniref:Calponin homology domain protein n=1 Tax=Entamoeba histolytica TaxID=5759 RepID=A0A175JK32_ENTHI|nr:hypothetical protein CL6EHI_094070 [Entamoeba histolytica]